jgi:Ca2+-binding RTX toxin-like protein
MTLWSVSDIINLIASTGTQVSGSSTQVTYTSGSTVMVAQGSFSNFDQFGDPQAGEVTSFSYTFTLFGTPVTMTVTGLQIPVASINSWAATSNTAAMEQAIFGAADTFTGTATNERINGFAGADTLNGEGGNDFLIGGLGDDTLNGGEGNDELDILGQAEGVNVLNGGAGNDRIRAIDVDTVDGGSGSDALTYAITTGVLNFTTTGYDTADGLTLSNGAVIRNVEVVDIAGAGGDDTFIMTRAGSFGSALRGGGGSDLLIADLSTATNDLNLIGSGQFFVSTFNGWQIDSIERYQVTGGSGNDQIWGGSGSDTLNGGAGNDNLQGLAGANTLNGGDGDDIISISTGTDVIDGGAGRDTINYGISTPQTLNWSALQGSGTVGSATFQKH